jgi:hypothetical protein
MAGGNKGDQLQAKLKGDILSFPVKIATAIYRGCMVAIDTATGYLVQCDDSATQIFVGIAEESCTAAQAVASGTVSIRVRRRGIFKLKLETAAAIPTYAGKLVYAAVANTGSVDELVDIATAVTNHCLIGRVVKHGPATNEVWVDIMGIQDTVSTATYLTLADAASVANGDGAALIGIEDADAVLAATTVEAALNELKAPGIIAQDDADLTITIAKILTGHVVLSNSEARTYELATPTLAQAGIRCSFKKSTASATAATLSTAGAETIDGAATFAAMDAQYDACTLLWTGTGWSIISKMLA